MTVTQEPQSNQGATGAPSSEPAESPRGSVRRFLKGTGWGFGLGWLTLALASYTIGTDFVQFLSIFAGAGLGAFIALRRQGAETSPQNVAVLALKSAAMVFIVAITIFLLFLLFALNALSNFGAAVDDTSTAQTSAAAPAPDTATEDVVEPAEEVVEPVEPVSPNLVKAYPGEATEATVEIATHADSPLEIVTKLENNVAKAWCNSQGEIDPSYLRFAYYADEEKHPNTNDEFFGNFAPDCTISTVSRLTVLSFTDLRTRVKYDLSLNGRKTYRIEQSIVWYQDRWLFHSYFRDILKRY